MQISIIERKSCENCGKIIKNLNIEFTNICQNPKTHYFCTKICKCEWLNETRKLL